MKKTVATLRKSCLKNSNGMSVEKQRVGAVSTQMKEMEPIVQSKQAVQFEHKKLCIEGLGENTSRDSLKYYVERISDTDVLEIEFGTRCNAIVTLDDELGTEVLERIHQRSQKKTLEGNALTIGLVPVCRKIVTDLPPSDKFGNATGCHRCDTFATVLPDDLFVPQMHGGLLTAEHLHYGFVIAHHGPRDCEPSTARCQPRVPIQKTNPYNGNEFLIEEEMKIVENIDTYKGAITSSRPSNDDDDTNTDEEPFVPNLIPTKELIDGLRRIYVGEDYQKFVDSVERNIQELDK